MRNDYSFHMFQRNRSGPRSTPRPKTKQDALFLDHISFIKNWLKSRVTDVSSLMFFLCFIILFLLLLCFCLLTSRSLHHQTDTKSLLGFLCKESSLEFRLLLSGSNNPVYSHPANVGLWQQFEGRLVILSNGALSFQFKAKWVETWSALNDWLSVDPALVFIFI